MPADVQQRVLQHIADLEIPKADLAALRVHPRGELFYVCDFSKPALPSSSGIGEAQGSLPMVQDITITGAVSIASPPAWHSRPESSNVVFLDFNGGVVSNTAWNSDPDYGLVPSWDCRPYSLDGNDATFSVTEQQAMLTIWKRVAEDYAPFDIDVTTEEPSSWNSHTGHVLITPDVDKNGVECPHYGYGGIAFVDVFGDPDYSYNYASECYSPAWVFNYEISFAAEYEAEAVAHEMGHNLSLSHDGTNTDPYYGGHNNGSISWGPIMGTGYERNVSQWSKGDYFMANNHEDDLALIAARVSYRPDDNGNDDLSATPLSIGSTGAVFQAGIVEQTLDTDVFSFTCGAGTVDIDAMPFRDSTSSTWGGDLDIVLGLYDSVGNMIATNNPELETSASIMANVTAGTYFLHVNSTGVGDPLSAPTPTGYVRYGSLGQYVISGSVPPSPDMDGDGLPDTWEMAFYGGTTNAVATADDDGDGQDNWGEYVSGYDPTNPASYFAITSYAGPSTSGAPFIVSWESITGRTYGVNWTSALTNSFTNISGALPYPANSYTDTVEHAGSQQFYKLEVNIEP